MLYPRSLYEDQGDELGSHQALDRMLAENWCDLLGSAGVEMHRRILGLAHNAEFETIEDETCGHVAKPRHWPWTGIWSPTATAFTR